MKNVMEHRLQSQIKECNTGFCKDRKFTWQYNNGDNIKDIAKAIKENILKLYKVCIGSYKEKDNAINTMNVAKSKGFSDAYII